MKQLQKHKTRRSTGTIELQITNDKIETKLNTSSYSQESFEDDEDSRNSSKLKNINCKSENEDDDDVETGD